MATGPEGKARINTYLNPPNLVSTPNQWSLTVDGQIPTTHIIPSSDKGLKYYAVSAIDKLLQDMQARGFLESGSAKILSEITTTIVSKVIASLPAKLGKDPAFATALEKAMDKDLASFGKKLTLKNAGNVVGTFAVDEAESILVGLLADAVTSAVQQAYDLPENSLWLTEVHLATSMAGESALGGAKDGFVGALGGAIDAATGEVVAAAADTKSTLQEASDSITKADAGANKLLQLVTQMQDSPHKTNLIRLANEIKAQNNQTRAELDSGITGFWKAALSFVPIF